MSGKHEWKDDRGNDWKIYAIPEGWCVQGPGIGQNWTRSGTVSEVVDELLNLAGQVKAYREALSGLLTWVGQCTPSEYVSWLKERGTPWFEAVEVQTCMFGTIVEAAWQALSQEEPVGTEVLVIPKSLIEYDGPMFDKSGAARIDRMPTKRSTHED